MLIEEALENEGRGELVHLLAPPGSGLGPCPPAPRRPRASRSVPPPGGVGLPERFLGGHR
jgi:hypothetical protein